MTDQPSLPVKPHICNASPPQWRHNGDSISDMAVQNCIGDAFRGATWVSLHNGGGVGWGEVINGGFGLVLDGSTDADYRAENMLNWDVSNGVARRYQHQTMFILTFGIFVSKYTYNIY